MSNKISDQWLKRYYPESAEAIAERVSQDNVALLQHSLRKWRGFRPKTLMAMGIETKVADGDSPDQRWLLVGDMDFFSVDSSSCALCVAFSDCGECPLIDLVEEPSRGCDIEFGYFTDYADPEPMIKLLEKALRLEKRKVAKPRRAQ